MNERAGELAEGASERASEADETEEEEEEETSVAIQAGKQKGDDVRQLDRRTERALYRQRVERTSDIYTQ